MDLMQLFFYNLPMVFFLGVFSSYQDFKKKIVSNKIIIASLIYALAGIIFYSLSSSNFLFLLKVLSIFIVLFLIGFLMWNLRIVGAGDSKLFIVYGLLLILPSYDGVLNLVSKFGGMFNPFVVLFPYIFVILLSFAIAFIINLILYLVSSVKLYYKSIGNFRRRNRAAKEHFRNNFKLTEIVKYYAILAIVFFVVINLSSLNLSGVIVSKFFIPKTTLSIFFIIFSLIVVFVLSKFKDRYLFFSLFFIMIFSIIMRVGFLFYLKVLVFVIFILFFKSLLRVLEDVYLFDYPIKMLKRGMILGEDIVDKKNKKILFAKGTRLKREYIVDILEFYGFNGNHKATIDKETIVNSESVTKSNFKKLDMTLIDSKSEKEKKNNNKDSSNGKSNKYVRNKKTILIIRESSFAVYIFISVLFFIVMNVI